ncbi:hypothetical protein [Amycolatopsis sp. NPDC051903]|uniref:hypothetical protein n=1 Tax=Amycolatopsis sp. NPDC051903 TaxID=3363936 RepID=UPI0037A99217
MADYELVPGGRKVPFEIQSTHGDVPSGSADLAEVVVNAVIHALGFPTLTLVRSVVLVLGRAWSELRVQLQGERTETRIRLFEVTAARFSTHLTRLRADPHWDPQVKALLDATLRAELERELSRIFRS